MSFGVTSLAMACRALQPQRLADHGWCRIGCGGELFPRILPRLRLFTVPAFAGEFRDFHTSSPYSHACTDGCDQYIPMCRVSPSVMGDQ